MAESPPVLGIIGGSGLLKSSLFSSGTKQIVQTQYGDVVFYLFKTYIFCQRHQADPTIQYSPPHLIPKKRIIAGFAQLGIKKILSFTSVGSLKKDIPIGTILVIDDLFNLWEPISFFDDARGHFVPNLNCALRDQVISVIKKANVEPFRDSGTYVQTTGPRFETKAEIRFLADYCDVVGMTAVHEGILCMELKMEYVIVSIVDNYAHGIAPDQHLTLEEFHCAQLANQGKVESVASLLVQQLAP
jgi:purine nucleoside phosphorylase